MTPQTAVALRHVREDELDPLKARLARHLPHSAVVYASLSLAARYGIHSFRPASILVPDSPRPSCLTIIAPITSGDEQNIEMFWSPEEHTISDLAEYLSLIPDLDWSQPKALIAVPRILLPELQSLDTIGGRRFQRHVKRKGIVYNLEASTVSDIKLPPVYSMSSLNEDEASTVWTNWDFNFLDCEDNIRQDIVHFPSIGIRERSHTDSAGSLQEAPKETLVSWIRTTKNGWMGNTFTLPHHRRRGLAGMATLALAHQMLQEGLLAFVVIEDTNTVSIKFHEGLGFKRQCGICMVVLVPAETNGQDYSE